MVFANLQEKEKDAFFSLLDEYFQSRPEIFDALSSQGNNNATAKAAQRALSAAPAAASAAANTFAKRGLTFGSLSGGGASTTGHTTSATDAHATRDQQQQGPDLQPLAGRVAAAAAAFSQQQRSTSGGVSSSGSTPNKLGGIDTSSLKNVFGNARASAQNAPSPPTFNRTPSVATPPRYQPEPEPEEEGEWAETLYDYASGEPGDLNITEGQRVWITEKTSDDWWTGEVDGKSGLFPASYVKLL